MAGVFKRLWCAFRDHGGIGQDGRCKKCGAKVLPAGWGEERPYDAARHADFHAGVGH